MPCKAAGFLKRMADADGTDDYYMWQVASGIRMVFDKTEAIQRPLHVLCYREKIAGVVNHFNLPTVEPTRSGYKFTGWNTKADGTGDVFTAETDVTESMTVYAQWQPLTSSGNLTVSKTVTGNAGDTSTEFHFHCEVRYTYKWNLWRYELYGWNSTIDFEAQ